MKKIFIASLCILTFASCNVKNSDEYKRLQAENDSIAAAHEQNMNELNDMVALMNDIEENFDEIRKTENYLAVQSKEKGALSQNKKEEIRSNIEMVNEILKKNKQDIAALNQRLKNSKGETSNLKSRIDKLNAELTERAEALTKLQQILQTKDAQIAELETSLQSLSEDVEGLTVQSSEQALKIKEQDKALNTAYYMFGTKNELKDAKVITGGGFLSSVKILSESIDRDKFVSIDIRDTQNIPVYAKKAKVLSEHPKDSYVLEKDATGNIVVKITDYKQFWNMSKFLIIQVD